MAQTREQTDRIEIDEDVIVGFSVTGGDISAEQLSKWAYRRLRTWPALLEACKYTQELLAHGVGQATHALALIEAAIAEAEKGD